MAGTATAPRWRRLGTGQRRAQILRTAHDLFRDRPYSEVSSGDIARAAGVTRGLLHHYFGTKRELFLEVVRYAIHRAPAFHWKEPAEDRTIEGTVDRGVAMWLDAIESDPHMFITLFGSGGFGQDPEIERIVSAGRDAVVDAMIAVLGLEGTGRDKAALRSYGALVEAATREWIQRRTLTRERAHDLLSAALVAVVDGLSK